MLLERHEAAQRALETLFTARLDGRWEAMCALLEAVDHDASGDTIRRLVPALARQVDRHRHRVAGSGTVVYLIDRMAQTPS